MTILTRLLDSLCDRIGLRMVFDGDLCAPSGDEDWWPAAASCGTGTPTTITDPAQPAAGHQGSDLFLKHRR